MKDSRTRLLFSRMPPWLSRAAGMLLGLVFLAAGAAKGLDMTDAIRQAGAYGIVTDRRLLTLLVLGLTSLECALGMALILGYRMRQALVATWGLLAVFIAALAWAWFTGITQDCGCFGQWLSRTPAQALLEDLFLCLLALAAWMSPHADKEGGPLRLPAVAASALFALALPFFCGFSLESSLVPGAQGPLIEPLAILDGPSVDWAREDFLLELMSTDCGHCIDSVPALNALSQAPDMPRVAALCTNTEEEVLEFQALYMPQYPIHRVGDDDFWRLVGAGDSPRFLLVHQGRVIHAWEQKAPEITDVRSRLDAGGKAPPFPGHGFWLALIPGLVSLYFAFLCVKTLSTGKPLFLSSRRHFTLIALPVMIMVGVSLWKIVVIPSYVGEKPFLAAMLLFFTACGSVLWKRGDWYYVSGLSPEDFLLGMEHCLAAMGLEHDREDRGGDDGVDNTVIYRLSGRPHQIRLNAFAGQGMMQFGMIPGAPALLKQVVRGLKTFFRDRDGNKHAPGFLAAACLLMALAAWSVFTQVHGINAPWLIERGQAYFQTNRDQAAVAALGKALALDPGSLDALRWRGAALARLGRDAEALADWKKALDLDPSNSDIMAHISHLHLTSPRMRDLGKALALAQKAVETKPDSVFGLDTLGKALAQAGDFKGATSVQERVASLLAEKGASRELMEEVHARLDAYRHGKNPD